jgi:NAD-dependent SIR2 family protein deacetylase
MSDLDSNNTMFYTLFNQLSENEQKSHDAIIGIVSIIYKEFLKTKNIDGLISKDDVNQHNLLQRMIKLLKCYC